MKWVTKETEMNRTEGSEGLKGSFSAKMACSTKWTELKTVCKLPVDLIPSYHGRQIFQEYLKSFLHWKHKEIHFIKGIISQTYPIWISFAFGEDSLTLQTDSHTLNTYPVMKKRILSRIKPFTFVHSDTKTSIEMGSRMLDSGLGLTHMKLMMMRKMTTAMMMMMKSMGRLTTEVGQRGLW